MRRIAPFMLAFASLPALVSAAPPRQASSAGENAAYHFLLARHLESVGKVPEAIGALRRAIELAPVSAELRAELAGLYARQDRAVEALSTAEEALELKPDNREANRILGTILAALAEQKRPLRPGDDPAQYAARGIAALEKARQPAGGDLGLELTLGRLYLRGNQNDKAIASLERVFEQQPEYSEGGMLLAAAQEQAGKADEAIQTLESTIQHNPPFFRAYLRLIALYEEQRRWKEAAGAYALAQGINPKADLIGGRAGALINGGAAKDAQTLLQAALAKKAAPDAVLLYLLAESQRQLKDYEAAGATTRRLREAFPDDPRGLVLQAQLQVAQGRQDDAIATLADLVKRSPGEPGFVYQYADLLERTGRIAEAEKALRELLARDPADATALNALGYMFAERGERLAEAVELIRRALTIEPGNPSFLDSLGWAFFKQDELARAESPLVEAAAKSPRNSVIQEHLGDLRFRQQRYAEAVAAWEQALAGDGDSLDRTALDKKLRDARARVSKK
ncbi:MAG: tetratricopeptide repeat protein [Acidobacteria bacterium]|nr:tetratricopeptide repeat protein [Acidobacteriota bacterium]